VGFVALNLIPNISNNTINENLAGAGGGIHCDESSPVINNNTITGNYATYFGGGIYCIEYSPTISNNTINENFANNRGGGIYCVYNSHAEAVNNILWANIATEGNEIYLDGSSSVTITYSDIQDTLWPGEGNIDADPYFCFSDTAYYWLTENSPCVEAGCDSLGNPDSTVNIGAFGIGCEEHLDISDRNIVLPYSFTLSQNYPNPFNPTTTISFAIEHPQFVTLKVYDLLGREIRTLIDGDRQAGQHTVPFDASNLSSGMYFYHLQAGDMAESKRMVLLK